jgi:hypothetical protein
MAMYYNKTGHRHFSASAGPVHQTKDRVAEQSWNERTRQLLTSEVMGDRKPS